MSSTNDKTQRALPLLQKLLGSEQAQKLPPYIQLAQAKVAFEDEVEGVRAIGKDGISRAHQSQYYDLHVLNKPISKIFDPNTLNNDEQA